MNRIKIQRDESVNDEACWGIVVADGEGTLLMRSRTLLTKTEANMAAKALKHSGGIRWAARAVESQEEGRWTPDGDGWRLDVIDTTSFEVVSKGRGPGGGIREIEAVFVEEIEIEWVPEHEDPKHGKTTPAKGLPGS